MATFTKTSLCCFMVILLLPISLLAQSKIDKTVVGTVGKEKVTYAEVKSNFSSGSSSAITLAELENFLPLYLDYKAKLLSAKDQGYYEDSTLLDEYQQYAKQAAYAYLLEKEIRPTAFEKYYQRATKEVKAYHILIAVNQNAPESKIEEVKAKLAEATEEIKNGTPLNEVNEKYSTVRNGRSMGGDLPWLTVGRTVIEFEDQIFNMEPGEISEPFATQFGYHIVLVQDKRPRTPARLANHIFVRPTQDSAAYKKIHEAYAKLENGAEWKEVTREFTEDAASRNTGGSIGWVSYNAGFAGDFIDAVVNVDATQDYSEPIRTAYGFHIFKIDSVQSYANEEEHKKALMEELEKSNYYKENNAFVLNYLQDKYGSSGNDDNLDEYSDFLSKADTTLLADLTLPSSLSSKTAYTFNKKKFTVGDFHSYLIENQSGRKANQYRSAWFNNFTEYVSDSMVIDLTLQNYPEFAQQTENYLNGLVVYKINDDFVWNAATVDTSKLMNIYNNRPKAYSYEERPYFYLISAKHDSTLADVKEFIANGNSPDSVRANISGVAVSSDSTSNYQEEPYNMLKEMEPGSFSDVFEFNKRNAIFYLVDKLPARKMTFEEAFNKLLADYQPEREQTWLQALRSDYKVKPNLKNLRKAFQKDPDSAK